jgi:hypothetical protein
MSIRVCSEVSCGCSTPDCFKVTNHGDLFIFVNEDTNRRYSVSKDLFFSGLVNKSLSINNFIISPQGIEKLINSFGTGS